jgi:hypothetical protein
MKKRLLFLLGAVAAATALCVPSALAHVHLKIAANGGLIDGFENWTAGQSWAEIRQFKNENATRPVVDLVLELQALKAGGLDFDFELVRTLRYDLSVKEVFEGRADLSAETIWDSEIPTGAPTLLKTASVIQDGEFVKGIYVLPTRSDMLKITSIGELRSHIGIVVGGWSVDTHTLEKMNINQLVRAVVPAVSFRQMMAGKADFTLYEFSANPDMSVEAGGVRLVPVPNCKVALAGSRSWVVSKNGASAQEIYQALNAGLAILRNNGTIERAFRESGFFDPRVNDWKRLF